MYRVLIILWNTETMYELFGFIEVGSTDRSVVGLIWLQKPCARWRHPMICVPTDNRYLISGLILFFDGKTLQQLTGFKTGPSAQYRYWKKRDRTYSARSDIASIHGPLFGLSVGLTLYRPNWGFMCRKVNLSVALYCWRKVILCAFKWPP